MGERGYQGDYSLGASEAELRDQYADIPVDDCIYCRSDGVEVAFVFLQPPGLRVAVPGRIGLCHTCLRLLRDRSFEQILERTRGTDFDDFADEDLLPLIRATAAAIPF